MVEEVEGFFECPDWKRLVKVKVYQKPQTGVGRNNEPLRSFKFFVELIFESRDGPVSLPFILDIGSDISVIPKRLWDEASIRDPKVRRGQRKPEGEYVTVCSATGHQYEAKLVTQTFRMQVEGIIGDVSCKARFGISDLRPLDRQSKVGASERVFSQLKRMFLLRHAANTQRFQDGTAGIIGIRDLARYFDLRLRDQQLGLRVRPTSEAT